MRYILLSLLLMLGIGLFAQTIPNAGFENWNDEGNYLEPVSWNTSNQINGNLAVNASRSSDAYSDSFALQLETVNVAGATFPGIATLGNIVQLEQGGFPAQVVAGTINGYYKFSGGIGALADSASVIAYFKRNFLDSFETDYIANIRLPEAGDYTFFQAPVLQANQSPVGVDTINIVIASSNINNPKAGTLLIDELTFTGVVSVPQINNQPAITTYPNPVHEQLNIQVHPSVDLQQLYLYNSSGKLIMQQMYAPNSTTQLDVSHMTPGLYYLLLTAANGQSFMKKVTVQ